LIKGNQLNNIKKKLLEKNEFNDNLYLRYEIR